MRKKRLTLLLGLGVAAAVFMAAGRGEATLGEVKDSVTADKNALSAQRVAVTPHRGYTVQQIDSDAVTVREYIGPDGVVFAVAWNGQTHPDLAPLLGRYAAEYEESIRHVTPQPGRRRLHVASSRIVVEKWGHMRNLQGRAYIPALIPDGVTLDEIK